MGCTLGAHKQAKTEAKKEDQPFGNKVKEAKQKKGGKNRSSEVRSDVGSGKEKNTEKFIPLKEDGDKKDDTTIKAVAVCEQKDVDSEEKLLNVTQKSQENERNQTHENDALETLATISEGKPQDVIQSVEVDSDINEVKDSIREVAEPAGDSFAKDSKEQVSHVIDVSTDALKEKVKQEIEDRVEDDCNHGNDIKEGKGDNSINCPIQESDNAETLPLDNSKISEDNLSGLTDVGQKILIGDTSVPADILNNVSKGMEQTTTEVKEAFLDVVSELSGSEEEIVEKGSQTPGNEARIEEEDKEDENDLYAGSKASEKVDTDADGTVDAGEKSEQVQMMLEKEMEEEMKVKAKEPEAASEHSNAYPENTTKDGDKTVQIEEMSEKKTVNETERKLSTAEPEADLKELLEADKCHPSITLVEIDPRDKQVTDEEEECERYCEEARQVAAAAIVEKVITAATEEVQSDSEGKEEEGIEKKENKGSSPGEDVEVSLSGTQSQEEEEEKTEQNRIDMDNMNEVKAEVMSTAKEESTEQDEVEEDEDEGTSVDGPPKPHEPTPTGKEGASCVGENKKEFESEATGEMTKSEMTLPVLSGSDLPAEESDNPETMSPSTPLIDKMKSVVEGIEEVAHSLVKQASEGDLTATSQTNEGQAGLQLHMEAGKMEGSAEENTDYDNVNENYVLNGNAKNISVMSENSQQLDNLIKVDGDQSEVKLDAAAKDKDDTQHLLQSEEVEKQDLIDKQLQMEEKENINAGTDKDINGGLEDGRDQLDLDAAAIATESISTIREESKPGITSLATPTFGESNQSSSLDESFTTSGSAESGQENHIDQSECNTKDTTRDSRKSGSHDTEPIVYSENDDGGKKGKEKIKNGSTQEVKGPENEPGAVAEATSSPGAMANEDGAPNTGTGKRKKRKKKKKRPESGLEPSSSNTAQ